MNVGMEMLMPVQRAFCESIKARVLPPRLIPSQENNANI